MESPELDTVLQVASHKSRADGQDHLPCLAGHSAFDATQDTVVVLGCQCTLLAHAELLVYQQPQALLLRAILSPLSAQYAFALGIALNSTVLFTNKDVQEHRTQYQALRNTTGQHFSLGRLAIEISSLRMTIHPILYSQSASSVK